MLAWRGRKRLPATTYTHTFISTTSSLSLYCMAGRMYVSFPTFPTPHLPFWGGGKDGTITIDDPDVPLLPTFLLYLTGHSPPVLYVVVYGNLFQWNNSIWVEGRTTAWVGGTGKDGGDMT